MKKQTQQCHIKFQTILKQINQLLEQQQYQKCQKILNQANFDNDIDNDIDIDIQIQIQSMKGYILGLMKKYNEGLQLLDDCLKKRIYHLASKKRRALILQKLGEYEQSLKQFQFCYYLEPQSKSLRNKIKRLTMSSAKSQSMSSEGGNTYQQKQKLSLTLSLTKQKQTHLSQNQNSHSNSHQNSHQKYNQNQKPKHKTQSVKFGNFEIIQITNNQQSDQHFAIIKDQINKLLDKKPKKSILKDSMSGAIFKQKNKQKLQQKLQQKQKCQQLSNSIKKQQQETIENQEQKQKIQKSKFQKLQKQQKIGLKKKAKSVTFKGDTNLSDFI